MKPVIICVRSRSALDFARAVRAHWRVENRLHWVLDVIFREDLARFRTGDGPQNMAIIRHTALNLLSRAKPTVSLKNRRKRAGAMSIIWKRSSVRPHDVQAIRLVVRPGNRGKESIPCDQFREARGFSALPRWRFLRLGYDALVVVASSEVSASGSLSGSRRAGWRCQLATIT